MKLRFKQEKSTTQEEYMLLGVGKVYRDVVSNGPKVLQMEVDGEWADVPLEVVEVADD
jgi:hypothetical protein